MHLFILLALLPKTDSTQPQNFIIARDTAYEIPLESGGAWGGSTRQADHATVAINEDRDILIAYHTTRSDIQNTGSNRSAFHEPLKQVEILFLKYDNQTEDWTKEDQVLIGSTAHNPRNSPFQDFVRCERPDVIAVGNRFFVVWTRRYDRDQTGQADEPAILECAWVVWNNSTSTLEISNGGLSDGLGFPLDDDYRVRECAGVPDAVMLHPGNPSSSPPILPTVGVVYPHQTEFGDIGGGAPDTRLCELRLVVTSLDSSNQIPTPDDPVPLVTGIDFNGPTAQQGQEAAGFILPDCARALPDPGTGVYRFWLAYEEQFLPLAGTVPDGRIRLCMVEQDATGPGWGALDVHTFGSSSSPNYRRRPNISSFPEDANGLDVVSIAFGKSNTTNNDDVVHQEWAYDPEAGISQIDPQPANVFENTSDDHTRPIPLHGRNSPLVRRLYVASKESPEQLLEYDVDSDDLSVQRSTSESLGRPAVAYWADLSSSEPDEFVLTWEEQATGVSYTRIYIRVL